MDLFDTGEVQESVRRLPKNNPTFNFKFTKTWEFGIDIDVYRSEVLANHHTHLVFVVTLKNKNARDATKAAEHGFKKGDTYKISVKDAEAKRRSMGDTYYIPVNSMEKVA